MSDVIIKKYNEVFLEIECSKEVASEIREEFSFRIDNYQYHPLVKSRKWDGIIKLFNPYSKFMYCGLKNKLLKFLSDCGYEYVDESEFEIDAKITPEFVHETCLRFKPHSKGNLIEPRYYQYLGVYHSLKYKRRLLLSATGSGKSLIIYLISRYLIENDKKILIVIDSKGLVEQIYKDFIEYAHNTFDVESNIHRIYQGKEKTNEHNITISTHQSIRDLETEWFENFDSIIIDEVDKASAKSFVKILEKCVNAEYRIGLTGSLDEIQVNKMVLTGLIGKTVTISKAKELIDEGYLSNLMINFIELMYPKGTLSTKKKTYFDEIECIINSEKRNEYISKLCQKMNGNTLVLFEKIEKHGKPLYETIKNIVKDKNVLFVHGIHDIDTREDVRELLEKSNNNIVVCSSIFKRGTNIQNLHNLVFAHPIKKSNAIIQMIGRGLRLMEGKYICNIYDICDILRKNCYLVNHGRERIKTYNKEEYQYKIIREEI